jgi:hypothetical protein
MAFALVDAPLLKPMATLAGWTFVMQAWMHATRIGAIGQYQVRLDAHHFDNDVRAKIPESINQIAKNYNHLHEQPTVFYAVTLALTILGDRHDYTKYAAWGYVGIRIFHSLYQALNNTIFTRFQIFATSSTVLAGMTARLLQLVYS